MLLDATMLITGARRASTHTTNQVKGLTLLNNQKERSPQKQIHFEKSEQKNVISKRKKKSPHSVFFKKKF